MDNPERYTLDNERPFCCVFFDPKTVPPEIKRWNWGAFLLNWIWGIGNQTYIALLALVPGFGFIWMIELGAKGSAWAWRNGHWDSVEHFKRVQRKWAIWGAIIWIAVVVFFGGVVGGVFHLLKHSAAYEMAVAKLETSPIATNVLGSPIATGTPFGNISFNGAEGKAELNFSATGPKAAGVVFVEAVKKNGVWSITRLALKLNDSGSVIEILSAGRGATRRNELAIARIEPAGPARSGRPNDKLREIRGLVLSACPGFRFAQAGLRLLAKFRQIESGKVTFAFVTRLSEIRPRAPMNTTKTVSDANL